MDNPKQEILSLVAQANSYIPDVLEPDLAPLDGYPNVPDWHKYESKIWAIGEQIRQILNENTKLRKDHQLQDAYLGVIKNERSKRGRQSFFFLVSYKSCNRCAEIVVNQLADDKVVGHAISALRKMGNGDYVIQINLIVDHPVTWIRNEAKKYVDKFGVGA
jgi:hypothetical protein